jgi:hypothetical protein
MSCRFQHALFQECLCFLDSMTTSLTAPVRYTVPQKTSWLRLLLPKTSLAIDALFSLQVVYQHQKALVNSLCSRTRTYLLKEGDVLDLGGRPACKEMNRTLMAP